MHYRNSFSLVLITILVASPAWVLALVAPFDFHVTEEHPIAIQLNWSADSDIWHNYEIQRKPAGTGDYEQIVTLPSNATHYIDLGLPGDSEYSYRIRYYSGEESSEWAYTTGITTVGPTLFKNVKTDYGALGDGATDDTLAIRQAIAEVQSAGGGTIYFPSGTYNVAPQSRKEHIFEISGNNITFLGDGPENTIISCYVLGGRDPETNWVELMDLWEPNKAYSVGQGVIWGDQFYEATSAGTSGATAPVHDDGIASDGSVEWKYIYTPRGYLAIFRGFAFSFGRYHSVNNMVFKGLRVTGNARPTGEMGWYTRTQFINGWDTSHKGLVLGFGQDKFNNILIEDCIWDSFRGEIIYSGSVKGGKVKLKNSKFYGTNSSAISTSADFECDGIEVWDAANACVESAFYDLSVTDKQVQYGIFRNSLFEPRRSLLNDNPVLIKNNSGKYGLAIFNQPNSAMIIDGCTIKHALTDGLYLAYAQHNLDIINNSFIDCASEGHTQANYIKFNLHEKETYKLKGGCRRVRIENNEFTKTSKAGAYFIRLRQYVDASMKDILIKNNRFIVTGNGSMEGLIDTTYDKPTKRVGLIIEDNFAEGDFGKLGGGGNMMPLWRNNDFDIDPYKNAYRINMQNPLPGAPIAYIHYTGPGEKVNIITDKNHYYPDGFEFKIIVGWMKGDGRYGNLGVDERWNSFSKWHKFYSGDELDLVKRNGKFILDRRNGRAVLNIESGGVNDLLFKLDDVIDYWDGLNDGETTTIGLSGESLTIINSDDIQLIGGENFVSDGLPVQMTFTRIGNVLTEIDRAVCHVALQVIE